MGLKKYIIGAVLLLVLAAGYVYSFQTGTYEIHFKQYSLVLPIAAWVIVPAGILFLFSVFHILFYGMKNYFAVKSVAKDSTTLLNIIIKRLKNEKVELSVTNENLNIVAEALSQLDISLENVAFHSSNKDLKKLAEKIIDIKSGKYISKKELKLADDNPLMIQNLKNRILVDDNFALEIVRKGSDYPKEIVKLAFNKVLDTKSMTTIKKYLDEISFDEEMVVTLLNKDSSEKSDFSLSCDMILNLVKNVKLSSNDLINLARNYKKTMAPDDLIKLYEDISMLDETYNVAYLYVLTEFQVIDKIREILNATDPSEYLPFRALVDLRDAGKHSYTLDSLCLLK